MRSARPAITFGRCCGPGACHDACLYGFHYVRPIQHPASGYTGSEATVSSCHSLRRFARCERSRACCQVVSFVIQSPVFCRLTGGETNSQNSRTSPPFAIPSSTSRWPPAAMKIACCPSYQRCPLSEVRELADKGRLHVHVTDGGVVLPLTCRKQAPPRPSLLVSTRRTCGLSVMQRVYLHVPLLSRAWSHAHLQLSRSLPPSSDTHPTHARTVLLVVRYALGVGFAFVWRAERGKLLG